ncbi:alpha/beta hydrolase [Mycobacterium sp. SMC-4]|uniref:alpha/beta hydrolase n=1 Tax=Mycobacterium sp. SMC-4 TaxID=2857059 RepID=UPI0021B2434A|nr:esterase [Mycobacterium sp. SMC-4]UXA17989.1 esterase [Mycobacterium sp. SMC-4]
MDTVEYAPRRLADVFGDPAGPAILVWHGTQTDARATVAPLCELLAQRGFGVVAADWDSHAADNGRADLLASAHFALNWSVGSAGLAVVGWSLGAVAAAGLTLRAAHYGVVVTHTVGLAGAFMASDPISGEPLPALVDTATGGAEFTLVHGVDDDVVPAEASYSFAADLRRAGWPVRVVELPTDHGAIAGARYDPAVDRYFPADDDHTRTVATDVADHIAAALAARHG